MGCNADPTPAPIDPTPAPIDPTPAPIDPTPPPVSTAPVESPVESPVEAPTDDLWESIFVSDFEQDQGIFLGNNKRFEGFSTSPGAWSLRIRNKSVLKTSRVSSIDQYSELSVRFMFQGKGMEVGEGFYLQTKFNGEQWVKVGEWVRGGTGDEDFENNEWMPKTVDIPTNGKKNLILRFKGTSNKGNDKVYIDDVSLSGLKV